MRLSFVTTSSASSVESHGGINAFNSEFCTALKSYGGCDVLCVVLQADPEAITVAKRAGVTLVELGSESESYEMISTHEIALTVAKHWHNKRDTWWVGHDVKSGKAALAVRELLGTGRVTVFHHMDYEAYYALTSNNGDAAIARAQEQRRVLAAADLVCAVGPKLAQSARDKLRDATEVRSELGVVEIVPGFPEIIASDVHERFRAITFGRLDPSANLLKQGHLAVAGFSTAVCRTEVFADHSDPCLTVIGLSHEHYADENEQLLKVASRYASRRFPINGVCYIFDREILFEELRRHSAALMLSLHEGFGLVGWEAIAAEVPLIVSRNSGLYELLCRTLQGVGKGCVQAVGVRGNFDPDEPHPDDVQDVADALCEIARNQPVAKQNARSLKLLLQRYFSWSRAVRTYLDACGLRRVQPFCSIGLAGGFPDPEIFGHSNTSRQLLNASQRAARIAWNEVAAGIGAAFAQNQQVWVRFTGVDAGNFSAAIVNEYISRSQDPQITSYFYGEYEDEDEAKDALLKEHPTYFERNNVSPDHKYLMLVGDVRRCLSLESRRYRMVDESEYLLAAGGNSSVSMILNRAMARRIPILAINAFGGITREDSSLIQMHNRELGISHRLLKLLDRLSSLDLNPRDIISTMESILDEIAKPSPRSSSV